MRARRLGHFESKLDQQIEELIRAINNGSIPPGTIIFVSRATPWPGWIKANGALLSRTEFAALWAEAQASGALVDEASWANYPGAYSTGDGSTTFRIPDLRGEFIRCWDNGRGVDPGREFGSNQEDAFQGHWHSLDIAPVDGPNAAFGASDSYNGTAQSPRTISLDNKATDPLSDGINGTPRTASETRPRNIALLACIKY